jgi:murein DD-endopeptidase MepM/ murein hydrolase activator NlpD
MDSRRLAWLIAAALVAPTAGAGAQTADTTTSTTPPSATTATTATTAPTPSAAVVDRQREIEQQIRALREAIGEASAEELTLLSGLTDTQDRLDGFDDTLARIDSELGGAAEKLREAQADVDRLDGRYLTLSAGIATTTRAIDAAEDDVASITAELYRRAGTTGSALTVLALDADSPQDLLAGARYLSGTAAAERDRIHRLAALKDRATRDRRLLEGERDEARAARDVVARERARIASLRREQESARNQVAAVVSHQERLLGEIRSKKSHFQSEIAALQAESNSIGSLLRNRQGSQVFVGSGSGSLIVPVSGSLSSGFGLRHHPILAISRMHWGVDFSVPYGAPIRAAGPGEVVEAGPRGGYGNVVIIDHGNTLATLYAHQSRVAVSVGQTVTAGQVIGAVGSTGLSTGPHLHFEVRVKGTPVNPLGYL